MRMGWVRMMPGTELMESLVLVVGRGSEGSQLGSQGRHGIIFHIGDQVIQCEGGVGVDRARGGSLHADVSQLGQAVLHVGVV